MLSGILGALLARLHARALREPSSRDNGGQLRSSIAEIIVSAVNIHAQAARLGVGHFGEESLSAADLIEEIPGALKQLATSSETCDKWREA